MSAYKAPLKSLTNKIFHSKHWHFKAKIAKNLTRQEKSEIGKMLLCGLE